MGFWWCVGARKYRAIRKLSRGGSTTKGAEGQCAIISRILDTNNVREILLEYCCLYYELTLLLTAVGVCLHTVVDHDVFAFRRIKEAPPWREATGTRVFLQPHEPQQYTVAMNTSRSRHIV